MKVILLDNIRGIGRVGDVKDVNDGYARNFLFPRGAAKPATAGGIKQAEAAKANKLQAIDLAHQEARALATRLDGIRIELTGKANAKGTLFAGVEAPQIAQALSKAAGAKISAPAIALSEHIKTVGDHTVRVNFDDDIHTDIIVAISATK